MLVGLLTLTSLARKEYAELGIDVSTLAKAEAKKGSHTSLSDASSDEGEESEEESGLDSEDEADFQMVRRNMPSSFVARESSDEGESEEGDSEEEESEEEVSPSDVEVEMSDENSEEESDASEATHGRKNRRATFTKQENKEAIKSAETRLRNYDEAIEYLKAHSLNQQGLKEIIKNKGRCEKTIEKMRESDDPKSESIYLPSEVSPETLFGKSTGEMNKLKAELISTINKSISEHQKLLQVIDK